MSYSVNNKTKEIEMVGNLSYVKLQGKKKTKYDKRSKVQVLRKEKYLRQQEAQNA